MGLLILAVLVAAAFGVGAWWMLGEDVGFTEDFGGDRLDGETWEVGEHPLGRGAVRPQNTGVGDGELRITLPAGETDGGEISTRSLRDYGSYRIEMRVPDAPGSITGFFLYRPPDYESEVDIEVYNDPSGRMLATTYAGGDPEPTNSETIDLPFDPTRGFHEYRFDYSPDGVRFYADGEPVEEFSDGFPGRPMRLYVNAWYPEWVAGGPPDSERLVRVERIEFPGEAPEG